MNYQPYPIRRRIVVKTAYILLRHGFIRHKTFARLIKIVMGAHREG